MSTLLQPVWRYCKELWNGLTSGWDRFWFTPVDPTTLAMIRILAGTLIFYIHITTTGELLNLVGPEGWIDAQAIQEFRQIGSRYQDPEQRYLNTWFAESIWFHVQDPRWMMVFQGIFLAATVCFTLGLCSRVSNVLVWIGHVSYLQRGYVTWFGMDSVLCMLLLYLMFGPTGATLSLDRLIARYRQARRGLALAGRSAVDLALKPRWSANVVIRLMQLHMCIIYLFAGLAKLQGNLWWNGTAAWYTMMVPELEIVSMRWLAYAPDFVYVLVVLGATYFTLIFEVSFIFLIWHRLLRPLLLLSAVALHGGIGLFMGLGGFGVAMMAGCLSFVSPTSLSWLIGVLFKGPAGLQYVYDPQVSAQLKAASWIAAADPYRQVALVGTTDRPPDGVSGYLVTKDGRRLSGFEAFVHLLGVLRCLWFVAPAAVWSFPSQRSEVLQKLAS